MNRQSRTALVLAVALVAAGIASYAVYRALARMPVQQVQVSTRKAVVAAMQLPVGTRLTRDAVKVIDWPAQAPLQGGFADPQAVVDRGLVAGVVENEPLTESKLAPVGAGAGLPPTITPGMRAISIKVNEVIGVAGFVVPGTHVDVVTIIAPDARGGQGDTVSRMVVSNVQVLTSGTRYDQEESRANGKPMRSTVVTLMVTPLDAERVALAQAKGELMLTLRHPLDVDQPSTPGVRQASLFSASPGADLPTPAAITRPRAPRAEPVVVAAAAPDPQMYTVETIRAAKRAQEVVR